MHSWGYLFGDYFGMKKGGFCQFYKDIYWGETVKNRTIVKWKLRMGMGQFNVFCITKAQGIHDQLDIIHCAFLKQKYYRYHPVMVYGIAKSYQEALDIILRISQEASIKGYDGRLLEYLESR